MSDYSAAALAYIHMKQLAHALHDCDGDIACEREHLARSETEPFAGFRGFTDRIAGFDVQIQEWKNGEFVEVT